MNIGGEMPSASKTVPEKNILFIYGVYCVLLYPAVKGK